MRLSCTVMEIWRLKDNGVTSLTFWSHGRVKERGKRRKGEGIGEEREQG